MASQSETPREPSALVEVKRPPVRPREVQRTAREQYDHGGFFTGNRPCDLDLPRPVDEQEIAGQGVFFEGIDPRSPGREQLSVIGSK